jgi:hypothetical protein
VIICGEIEINKLRDYIKTALEAKGNTKPVNNVEE